MDTPGLILRRFRLDKLRKTQRRFAELCGWGEEVQRDLEEGRAPFTKEHAAILVERGLLRAGDHWHRALVAALPAPAAPEATPAGAPPGRRPPLPEAAPEPSPGGPDGIPVDPALTAPAPRVGRERPRHGRRIAWLALAVLLLAVLLGALRTVSLPALVGRRLPTLAAPLPTLTAAPAVEDAATATPEAEPSPTATEPPPSPTPPPTVTLPGAAAGPTALATATAPSSNNSSSSSPTPLPTRTAAFGGAGPTPAAAFVATATGSPLRTTRVTITGLPGPERSCLTVVFLRGGYEVGRVALEGQPDPAVLEGPQADQVRFDGNRQGTCPWQGYSIAENPVLVVGDAARASFAPIPAPPRPAPTLTPTVAPPHLVQDPCAPDWVARQQSNTDQQMSLRSR